jgi:hypothetical protein
MHGIAVRFEKNKWNCSYFWVCLESLFSSGNLFVSINVCSTLNKELSKRSVILFVLKRFLIFHLQSYYRHLCLICLNFVFSTDFGTEGEK